MKYLVNRKTKEHKAATREDLMLIKEFGTNSDVFDLVEADFEGWIAHTGKECPLPDDARCDIKFSDGEARLDIRPVPYNWRGDSRFIITHYRPILTEKVQVPVVKDSFTTDLLDRLDAAHKAAQQIPDLEAELRRELAGMGYTLGKMSPFVEPEAVVETPQDNKYAAEW